MNVNDAEPGDIYADANGKLWRILSVVHEPTVEAEEVEGTLRDPNNTPALLNVSGINMQSLQGYVAKAEIIKAIRRAPTGSSVWFGFERVYRRLKAMAS